MADSLRPLSPRSPRTEPFSDTPSGWTPGDSSLNTSGGILDMSVSPRTSANTVLAELFGDGAGPEGYGVPSRLLAQSAPSPMTLLGLDSRNENEGGNREDPDDIVAEVHPNEENSKALRRALVKLSSAFAFRRGVSDNNLLRTLGAKKSGGDTSSLLSSSDEDIPTTAGQSSGRGGQGVESTCSTATTKSSRRQRRKDSLPPTTDPQFDLDVRVLSRSMLESDVARILSIADQDTSWQQSYVMSEVEVALQTRLDEVYALVEYLRGVIKEKDKEISVLQQENVTFKHFSDERLKTSLHDLHEELEDLKGKVHTLTLENNRLKVQHQWDVEKKGEIMEMRLANKKLQDQNNSMLLKGRKDLQEARAQIIREFQITNEIELKAAKINLRKEFSAEHKLATEEVERLSKLLHIQEQEIVKVVTSNDELRQELEEVTKERNILKDLSDNQGKSLGQLKHRLQANDMAFTKLQFTTQTGLQTHSSARAITARAQRRAESPSPPRLRSRPTSATSRSGSPLPVRPSSALSNASSEGSTSKRSRRLTVTSQAGREVNPDANFSSTAPSDPMSFHRALNHKMRRYEEREAARSPTPTSPVSVESRVGPTGALTTTERIRRQRAMTAPAPLKTWNETPHQDSDAKTGAPPVSSGNLRQTPRQPSSARTRKGSATPRVQVNTTVNKPGGKGKGRRFFAP